MLGPFPVSAVLSRLAERVKRLRLISGAADLATARGTAPKAVPACFVIATESAQPPAGATSGQLVQRVEVALHLVLFVRNVAAQDMGAAARGDMDALITDVRRALIGWSPGPEFDPLSLRATRDEDYALGQLVVQEVYRTFYRLTVST